MAQLWRALDRETRSMVMVKALLAPGDHTVDGISAYRDLCGRFRRECELLGKLDAPNIPCLLYRDLRPSEPFYVMEFITGLALDLYLKKYSPPPVEASAAIVVDLLDGLKVVHAAQAVHRDLKPANAVIDRSGTTWLIDLGIAFLLDPAATRYTQAGATPGSHGFKAPEILRGDGHPTHAADIYSLGCLTYLLLTAHQVFDDRSEHLMARRHLEERPPRPSLINPRIPKAIDDHVLGMLEKSPGARPSIAEIRAAFAAFLPSLSGATPSPLLDPDPTARYRGAQSQTPPQTRLAGRRSSRPPQSGVNRETFGRLRAEALTEIRSSGPGRHLDRLRNVLPDARNRWGVKDEDILRGLLLVADALRAEDHNSEAKAAYQEVLGHASASMADVTIEARLGIAECRISLGDAQRAHADWTGIVRDMSALPDPSPHLTSRINEVRAYLDESGFAV
ncbi:serine/threonine protein kinase [Herbidospora galbida]|uniref:non-specific serine/threonine protein kinase n=1 Tax=Herbidospora galbida TaxID=2575442 RepID=A0A4U3MB88_9ACTN|nr:serine/threonine-protein kinase [Herbidospora galbida]TKK85374.1 serine/threonine protein kinase [Herbidospora galbida]